MRYVYARFASLVPLRKLTTSSERTTRVSWLSSRPITDANCKVSVSRLVGNGYRFGPLYVRTLGCKSFPSKMTPASESFAAVLQSFEVFRGDIRCNGESSILAITLPGHYDRHYHGGVRLRQVCVRYTSSAYSKQGSVV